MVYVKNFAKIVFLLIGLSPGLLDLDRAAFWRQLIPRGGKDLMKIVARVAAGGSILTILILVRDEGFSTALKSLVETYDRLLGEIVVRAQLDHVAFWIAGLLRGVFDIDLPLQGYWKHVFTLIGLYFFRQVALNFKARIPGTAVFNLLTGIAVALAAAVWTGLIDVTSPDVMDAFLIVAIPLYAAELHHLVGVAWDATVLRKYQAERRGQATPPSWWGHFRMGLNRGVSRTFWGLTIALVLVHVPAVCALDNPGLAALVLLVFLFGIYWLIDAIPESRKFSQTQQVSFAGYIEHDHAHLGAAIVGSFGWALIWAAGAAEFYA